MGAKRIAIRVAAPDGFRLLGCRTDDDIAILICEANGPDVRQIGFIQYGEIKAEENDEENAIHDKRIRRKKAR